MKAPFHVYNIGQSTAIEREKSANVIYRQWVIAISRIPNIWEANFIEIMIKTHMRCAKTVGG